MGEPRYLDTKQAADYLGLSVSTLEKLRVTGRGPRYAKAGRRVIYDRRDLDRWMAARKRGFTGESVDEDELEDEDEPEDEDGSEEGDESRGRDGDGPEDDSGPGGEEGSEDDSGSGA